MGELDDFLTGGEQPAIAEETAEQPEVTTQPEETPVEVAEEPKGPTRDEKGRFAPKGETAETPAAEEHTIPVKALQEERRKRQELEQRLAAIEAANQQPPAPPPSIWEDEQGYGQHIVQSATEQAVQAATFNARLDMSEMMVRQSHPDFDDKKTAFLALMDETPGLREKALSDPHPWNFAYNYVANHERMQQLAAVNVTDLEAKLRAQIEAEYAAKAAPAVETPPIPDSLASAQSARAAPSAQGLHVPSLDEILKR